MRSPEEPRDVRRLDFLLAATILLIVAASIVIYAFAR